MKRTLSLLATLALASTANANTKTEYFYQSKGGAFDLNLGYNMGSTSGQDAGKITDSSFGFGLAYGLSDSMELSLATTTGERKFDPSGAGADTKEKGMSDLVFGFQMNNGMLYYGADLSYSGKTKSDKRTTGGISVIPSIGVLMSSGELNYGGKFSYAYNMDKKTEGTPDITTQGGHAMTLAGFGEMNMGAGHLWGELALVSYQDEKNKATSAKTKLGSETNVTVGYSYHVSEMITALASYEHSMVSGNEKLGADKKWTAMTWNLGARLSF
ncbi:MAG: hypothetical protein LW875_00685 [Proteobacteria bacterium]|jgi:hypothetical protein|nr:hypothetical protein [Pseudomonadota bacterium]